MSADTQCYKQLQNHSVSQIVGIGASIYYWKEISTKKSEYRPLKTFGVYLLGNLLCYNLINLINTPPKNCTLKTALGITTTDTTNMALGKTGFGITSGITTTDTTNMALGKTGFGISPTGSPVLGLAGCGTCRDKF